MTLARKMGLKIVLLVVSVVMLAGAALYGVSGLNQNVDETIDCAKQLRVSLGLGVMVEQALTAQDSGRPGAALEALGKVEEATRQFSDFLDTPHFARGISPTLAGEEQRAARDTLASLTRLRDQLAARATTRPVNPAAAGTTRPATDSDVAMAARTVMQNIARISDLTKRGFDDIQDHAQRRVDRTLWIVGCVSVAIIVVTILINISQYYGVMQPLRRFSAAVRSIAAGNFRRRLVVGGDDEIASLSQDFNRMAAELDGLYRELEEKVAVKSKELVRSERLASVGFLAAGVAHEINNPLGIISGYAELSLRAIDRGDGNVSTHDGSPQARAQLRQALEIIRDEAFRCKQITEKLLSLSRQGSESRQSLSLAETARDVAAMVGGLRKYHDRKVTLHVDSTSEDDRVLANETEMKQVLLNLTVNALEAVEPGVGEVTITCERQGDPVVLIVSDNGRGMNPETLERVFEPFYTDKRGVDTPGTGLGLSIVHAIIQDHGGTIRATSAGPGHGSQFVVTLPALAKQALTAGDAKPAVDHTHA